MLFCCNATLLQFNIGIVFKQKVNVMRCKIPLIAMLFVCLKDLDDCSVAMKMATKWQKYCTVLR